MRKWFVSGDVDGFFGLFIDNLLQLMLIAVLCPYVCGFPQELIVNVIMPGAAVSILFGNLFYAWEARKLARETGNPNVTALPYGINTPSLLAFIFLVMGPVYRETGSVETAWRVGVFACFLSGVIESAGAFFGNWFRKSTPRATLLSALAGIAITYIAMGFVFQLFASPVVALIPMLMILFAYATQTRFPLHIPGGIIAIVTGTILGWVLRPLGWSTFHPISEAYEFALHFPVPVGREFLMILTDPTVWHFLPVIIPMALFNLIGSLQNLESAAAAGDHFDTRRSMLANGMGSIIASLFGSAFPTTIYIGHPGWKAMGARQGYSVANGIVITLLILFGGMTLILKVIPIEATLGILLWVGLIITAQAFQAVSRKHAPAVALGMIPCLAAWGLTLIETTIAKTGTTLYEVYPRFGSQLYIHGLISLSQGFILTAMILSAILVYMIEKKLLSAAWWSLAGAALSAFGIIHAYRLTHSGVAPNVEWMAAPDFAAAYLFGAVMLVLLHYYRKFFEPVVLQSSEENKQHQHRPARQRRHRRFQKKR